MNIFTADIMLFTHLKMNKILPISMRNISVNNMIIIEYIISVRCRFVTSANMATSEVMSVTRRGRIILVDEGQECMDFGWTNTAVQSSAEDEAIQMSRSKSKNKISSCIACFTKENDLHVCDRVTIFYNTHSLLCTDSFPCKRYQISVHIPKLGHVAIFEFTADAMQEFIQKCFISLCSKLELQFEARLVVSDAGIMYAPLDTWCKMYKLSKFFSSKLWKILRIRGIYSREADCITLYRADLSLSKCFSRNFVNIVSSNMENVQMIKECKICLIQCETVIAIA